MALNKNAAYVLYIVVIQHWLMIIFNIFFLKNETSNLFNSSHLELPKMASKYVQNTAKLFLYLFFIAILREYACIFDDFQLSQSSELSGKSIVCSKNRQTTEKQERNRCSIWGIYIS